MAKNCWTQKEIHNEITPPDLPDDHPATGRPKDFKWEFVNKFNLNLIHGLDDYQEEYEEWMRKLKRTHSLGEASWLQDIYLPYPDRFPIAVVVSNGVYHLWDGKNRVSVLLELEQKHAPAFVGR